MNEIENQLYKLINLCKKEFGEEEKVLIGYVIGNIYDGYDADIMSEKEIFEYFQGDGYDEILKDFMTSSKECEVFENFRLIAKRYKIVNKGWKMEIIEMLNKKSL